MHEHNSVENKCIGELIGLAGQELKVITSRNQSNEDISLCLRHYQQIEVRLYGLLMASFNERNDVRFLILSVNCLDRICVITGPQQQFINILHGIEEKFGVLISEYNTTIYSERLERRQSLCNFLFPQPFGLGELDIPRLVYAGHENDGEILYAHDQPFMTADICHNWPALSKWSMEYFSLHFGHRVVPVEIGRSYVEDDWRQALMPIGELIQTFYLENSETHYMAQFDLCSHIPVLSKDINIPLFVHEYFCDSPIINIWIGPAGTRTPLHYDPYNNLFTQIYGRKRIHLISPEKSSFLSNVEKNTCKLQEDQIIESGLPTYSILLLPGETLFIPKLWWHMVIAESPSISASIWY